MTYAISMQLNSINFEEYTLEDSILKKGEKAFSGDLSKMDELKEKSGADITIFYGNERILTTIVDEQGQRVIHTSVLTHLYLVQYFFCFIPFHGILKEKAVIHYGKT